MNFRLIKRILGSLLLVETLLLIPPTLIAFFDKGTDFNSFIITIAITLIIGLIMVSGGSKSKLKAKDGLFIVSAGWIIISIFGALPLYLSKSCSTFIDAFFEIVSGFTTTGATVIVNVEGLERGILFWRSFTHWIGGMGILIFTLAIIPALGIGGFQIYKAESPGPNPGKIAPKIKDTAKILYITYIIITVLEVAFLLFGGMDIYDSLVYTFGTVGTGGFGTKLTSVAYYNSSYIDMVIATFMVLSGVCFAVYYEIYRRNFSEIKLDGELKLYLGLIFCSALAIAANLFLSEYNTLLISLRDSFFQVSSIITTTGYVTADYDLWPNFSKSILFLLMIIGSCAGSTAGGIKVIRLLVIIKLVKRGFAKMFHPHAVIHIREKGKSIPLETVAGINSYLGMYFMVFALGTIVITLDGVDLVSASSSVVSTLSNIGPAFGFAGPSSTYAGYSQWAKLLFSVFMLLGRLEFYTMLALIVPRTWRKEI